MNPILSEIRPPQALRHLPDDVLLLPTSERTLCIPLDSIIRVEASSNYSKVFCRDQRFPIVVAKVLRWFEASLPAHLFTRIHRAHLINKMYVVSVRGNVVNLGPGTQINISRRKKKDCVNELQCPRPAGW